MASHEQSDRRHARRQRPPRSPRYSDESDTSEHEYGSSSRRPPQRGGGTRGGHAPGYPSEPPTSSHFRERRDGYLSDEGEYLKKSRKPRPRRDESDSEGKHSTARSIKDKITTALPILSNSRAKSMEAPLPYGADPRGHAPDERRRPRRSAYDEEPERAPQRTRSHREPRRRNEDNYDDFDDYERPHRGPERRDEHRRSGGAGLYPPDPERGYRSDQGNRRRDPRDSRRDNYQRDPHDQDRDRRRRDDGYRDYHSDRDDKHRDARRRDTHGGDPRDRYGGGRERDRHRSSRDYDDYRGGGRSRGKSNNWQKDAGQLFLTYGLPYLKKEGPNLVRQAQTYWTKRGGGA